MPKVKGSPVKWTVEEFLKQVIKDESGCWFLPTNRTRAHTIAYRLFNGEIPKTNSKGGAQVAMFVCHTCDTPECCNPKHLWLGTAKDNNDDRAKKGRSYRPVDHLNVMKRSELKTKRAGQGNPMYGRTHSEESKKKIGDAGRGELSESKRPDVRAKLSASGKAVPNVVCEHCGKELKPWTHARWHGENCNER